MSQASTNVVDNEIRPMDRIKNLKAESFERLVDNHSESEIYLSDNPTHQFTKGPWDQGHWANRQPK